MKSTPSISAEEVAEVLRRAARGDFPVVVLGDSWAQVQCGDVTFSIAGWTIVIFNDCMSVDYVDSVIAPDGRAVDYSEWFIGGGGADPINLISASADLQALETRLENA